MDTLSKLEEIFKSLPGIGPRQAKRFAYFLLTKSDFELADFAKNITELKKSVSMCSLCQRFFPIGNRVVDPIKPICSICSDQNRDTEILMIVGRDIDLQAVERSRAYNGLYFVLGGSVPILEEFPEQKIRQKELIARMEEMILGGLKEIILATSVNPEGEHTAQHISTILRPYIEKHKFRVSTLGRGLSTGTELEYSDSETLKSALQNRR